MKRLGLLLFAAACQVDSQVGSNYLALTDSAPTTPACRDRLDNDGDDLVDFPFEPGCTGEEDDDESDPATAPACSNGGDDDGDEVTDFPLEIGCESAADDDEVDPAALPQCADTLDNDTNGDIDYPTDHGCYAVGDPREYSVVN